MSGCGGISGRCGVSIPWLDYGLPQPVIDGYRHTVDAGVVRTRFDDGSVRQRRRRPRGRRVYELAWEVDGATIQTLELFLAAYGPDWFTLPTPTGDLAVRIISDLEVSLVRYNLLRATATAEAAPTL